MIDFGRIDLLTGLVAVMCVLVAGLFLDRIGVFKKVGAIIHPSEHATEHAAYVDLVMKMYANSPLAWIAVDNKARVILWSPVAVDKFGYTASEAMGARLEDLIIPDELKERHRKGIERFMITGSSTLVGNKFGFETEGITKTGTKIPLRIVLTDMSEGGKRKVGAYVYNRSSEVQREKEFKQNLNILECSEEAAGIGGWCWDLDSHDNLVYVTKNFRKIFGIDEHDTVTAPSLVEKIMEADREEVIRTMDAGFEQQTNYKVSYRIKSTGQWVHCIGIVVPGENKPHRIYGSIQEIEADG